MADTSRRQQIIEYVKGVLEDAAPVGTTVRKGRKAPQNESKLPMVQIYWHIEQIHQSLGNPRRPMKLQRNLTLEIKITTAGDDIAFDEQCQWVITALWNAGNLGGLVTNLSEAETVPYLEDSSVNDAITAGAIRYVAEFTTLPGDVTAAN